MSSRVGPGVSPRVSSPLGHAEHQARRARLARPRKSWTGEVQARRAGPGRAGQGWPTDGLWVRGTGGSRARPRSSRRNAAPRWGWEESGNSQPLVLRLQLPVHGEREAEEAPGIPRFPDHVVLPGVQVEGCAQPGQKPRGQVEQAQLARDRHGRARREGRDELQRPQCARARGRGRACLARRCGH